jgi:hypothetical protein
MMSIATIAIATKAVKALMWPTRRTMAGVFSVPSSISRKIRRTQQANRQIAESGQIRPHRRDDADEAVSRDE